MSFTDEDIARFSQHIKYWVGEKLCWEWQATKMKVKLPYGIFQINKKRLYAHRISYMMNNYISEIPKGLVVCHNCDNPKCVRPDHLWLGTPYENAMDCVNKGRRVYHSGDRNKRTKILSTEFANIQELSKTKSHRQIAKIYNVSKTCIGDILQRIKNG